MNLLLFKKHGLCVLFISQEEGYKLHEPKFNLEPRRRRFAQTRFREEPRINFVAIFRFGGI